MPSIMEFAQQMIQNNKNNVPNVPWAVQAITAIMTGNAELGQQIADNLCQTYGVSREQAIQQARQKMKFPF